MAAETNKEKFAKLSPIAASPPPPFPRIPQAIKDRHPENAPAWNQYENSIDAWVRAVLVSKSTIL